MVRTRVAGSAVGWASNLLLRSAEAVTEVLAAQHCPELATREKRGHWKIMQMCVHQFGGQPKRRQHPHRVWPRQLGMHLMVGSLSQEKADAGEIVLDDEHLLVLRERT